MATIFFDENSPESTEYSSNYEYFDEKKPGAVARMMRRWLEVERKKYARRKQYEIVNIP